MHPDIPQAATCPLNAFGVLCGVYKERSALERPAMQDTKAIPESTNVSRPATFRDARGEEGNIRRLRTIATNPL